jgi:hypothetical protein
MDTMLYMLYRPTACIIIKTQNAISQKNYLDFFYAVFFVVHLLRLSTNSVQIIPMLFSCQWLFNLNMLEVEVSDIS